MNRLLYLSILVFAILLFSVNQEVGIVHLDDDIRQKIQEIWSPSLNKLIIWITDFGAEFSVFLSLIIVCIYFGFKKQGLDIRFFLSAMFGSIVLFAVIKELVGRERPTSMMVIESDLSFPSGHATIATIIAWFVYLVFVRDMYGVSKRVLTIFCLSYPLLMSFTRVYLNVHYLSDVIAGIALGTCWMIILSKFYIVREA